MIHDVADGYLIHRRESNASAKDFNNNLVCEKYLVLKTKSLQRGKIGENVEAQFDDKLILWLLQSGKGFPIKGGFIHLRAMDHCEVASSWS